MIGLHVAIHMLIFAVYGALVGNAVNVWYMEWRTLTVWQALYIAGLLLIMVSFAFPGLVINLFR